MKAHVVDEPNERKVHTKPVPRVGGIAFAFGSLIPILFLQNYIHMDRFFWSLMIGAWIIVLFGFLDDIKNLDYRIKFSGQLLASLVVILNGGLVVTDLGTLLPEGFSLPGPAALILTLVTIIGVTNAINLADGLDGLAGGISLLSFVCIGYLSYLSGASCIAFLSAAMAGGLFGFLRFNTFPATIFMGDAGSQLIGFLAVILSLKLTQENMPLSPMLPLLLLGFPVLDTLTVMISRKINGKPLFKADKNHFHHKLMTLGLYHKEAVFLIYMIQAVLVTFAFLLRFYSEGAILSFYILFTFSIFIGVIWANKKGYQLKRPGIFDRVVKQRLRIFREENTLIKISYKALVIMLILTLLLNVILPREIPLWVSPFAFLFALLLFMSSGIFKKCTAGILRISLYFLIPYLGYMDETGTAEWMTEHLTWIHNLLYIIMALLIVFTIKLTRRSKGFKVTPMDFIILFTAFVIPNLPDVHIRNNDMGMMAIKIILLFFSFEVWICEQREKLVKPVFTAALSLLILGIRGLVQLFN